MRGGHGLFAVVELVRDRDTREPLAPWPQLHPALRRLLQATRWTRASPSPRAATCILLAPPLVIAERELADALDLLDRLLGPLAQTLRTEESS